MLSICVALTLLVVNASFMFSCCFDGAMITNGASVLLQTCCNTCLCCGQVQHAVRMCQLYQILNLAMFQIGCHELYYKGFRKVTDNCSSSHIPSMHNLNKQKDQMFHHLNQCCNNRANIPSSKCEGIKCKFRRVM